MKLGDNTKALMTHRGYHSVHVTRCSPRHDSNPLRDALTNAATAVLNLLISRQSSSPSVTAGISPSKQAAVSGQYLDQLEKLIKLLGQGS